MYRGNRKRDVTTMVTYSHASTPLGQSERLYYLSYFVKNVGEKPAHPLRIGRILSLFARLVRRTYLDFALRAEEEEESAAQRNPAP